MKPGEFFVCTSQPQSLGICEVSQAKVVERECPRSGDHEGSSINRENHVCPLCGVTYEAEFYGGTDPEYEYTHPTGIRKMTEVTIVAIVSQPGIGPTRKNW